MSTSHKKTFDSVIKALQELEKATKDSGEKFSADVNISKADGTNVVSVPVGGSKDNSVKPKIDPSAGANVGKIKTPAVTAACAKIVKEDDEEDEDLPEDTETETQTTSGDEEENGEEITHQEHEDSETPSEENEEHDLESDETVVKKDLVGGKNETDENEEEEEEEEEDGEECCPQFEALFKSIMSKVSAGKSVKKDGEQGEEQVLIDSKKTACSK